MRRLPLIAWLLLAAGCAGGGDPSAAGDGPEDLTRVHEVVLPAEPVPKPPGPAIPLVVALDLPVRLASIRWPRKDDAAPGDLVSAWRGAHRIAVLEILRTEARLSLARILEDDPDVPVRVGDEVRREGRLPGAPAP